MPKIYNRNWSLFLIRARPATQRVNVSCTRSSMTLLTLFFLNKVSNVIEDLVQETFTRCVAGRARIRNNDQFRLYIFGIAYHVLKTHLRERYRGGDPVSIEEISVRDIEPGP